MAAGLVLAGTFAVTQSTGAQGQGYITTRASMVKPAASNVQFKPILTVGDTHPNGYQMAGIPDGLGAMDNGDGTFTLYMNHELSARNNANLSETKVSKLRIDKNTLQVLDAKYVVDGSEGYRRFCSSTMVGPNEGFDRHYYLTGEEDTTGKWGGLAVVIDTANDVVTQLPHLGKLRWENIIAVPGFVGKTVLVGFDDTTPGGVYMYIAPTPNDVWTGRGDLYVFVADGGARFEDKISKSSPLTGRFVRIDQGKASTNYDSLLKESDAVGHFKFSRPEDGTYSRTEQGLIYFNVTGSSTFTDTVTGKAYDAKGRVFSMKLDANDPTRVTSLKVLLDGDAGDDILSPDNIDASETHLVINEDINAEFNGIRAARVTAYEIATGRVTPLGELPQLDYNNQPIPNDKLGSWETSGIINAADILGQDVWLFDVQAHTFKVPQFNGQDEGGQLLAMYAPGTAPVSRGGGGTGNIPTGMPSTGGEGQNEWLYIVALLLVATFVVSGTLLNRGRKKI
jgi:hypothetical protein